MYADRGVQAAEAADTPQARAFAYAYRGGLARVKGEFPQALRWYQRALELSEAHGILYWVSVTSCWVGATLGDLGQAAESLTYIERGLDLQKSMGTKVNLSLFHVVRAVGLLRNGKAREARDAVDRAIELAAESGERPNEIAALLTLGQIAAAADPLDLESAAAHYRKAEALATDLGMRPALGLAHFRQGQVLHRMGKRQEAHEHLETAAGMFKEMGMRFWLEQAEAELKAVP
jgi:tetratricopeptide (TPR) repeat protein